MCVCVCVCVCMCVYVCVCAASARSHVCMCSKRSLACVYVCTCSFPRTPHHPPLPPLMQRVAIMHASSKVKKVTHPHHLPPTIPLYSCVQSTPVPYSPLPLPLQITGKRKQFLQVGGGGGEFTESDFLRFWPLPLHPKHSHACARMCGCNNPLSLASRRAALLMMMCDMCM